MTDDNGQSDSVDRFSPRAGEYTRHRPDYPDEALDYLESRGIIDLGTEVADVGAGTGIFTEQLIARGCKVWAVEPNAAMRTLAENDLQSRNMFHSVPADAEDIRMDDDSVDVVTVAQALHWFDIEAAREEFRRILRSPKRVVLLWNIRKFDANPFMEDFEDVVAEYGIDYEDVYERYDKYVDSLDEFFGGDESDGVYTHRTFDHIQPLDRQGLLGLVTSFSYMPRPSDDGFDEMVSDIQGVFDDHAEGGEVEMLYDTEMFFGTLD